MERPNEHTRFREEVIGTYTFWGVRPDGPTDSPVRTGWNVHLDDSDPLKGIGQKSDNPGKDDADGEGSILGSRKPSGHGCPEWADPISLPDWYATSWATQWCFIEETGDYGWPETDCCPPEIGETPFMGPRECTRPTFDEARQHAKVLWHYSNKYATDDCKFGDTTTRPRSPTTDDLIFFWAAVSLLVENSDLAEYALCLVDSWSPETRSINYENKVHGRLDMYLYFMTLDSSGKSRLHVTFVDYPDDYHSESGNEATAWAFTIQKPACDGSLGIILPISISHWVDARNTFHDGTEAEAICVATNYASIILHEIVHILGDHFEQSGYGSGRWTTWENRHGTKHEESETVPYPCWDECRMIATMFQAFMAQRFPCMKRGDGCKKYDDADRFAHSSSNW